MGIMGWIWLAAIVILCILEAVTTQLVCIWFVAGSVAAFVTELLGGPIWLQILLFVVVSAVVVAATRPLVKKLTKADKEKTNADRVVGMTAIVTEDIDNINGTGLAKVAGQVWSARSADNSAIEQGREVKIERIEGVKLIVK